MTARKKEKDMEPLGTGLEELLELMEREVDEAGLGIHLDAMDGAGEPDAAHPGLEELFRSGLQALKTKDYVVAAAHFLAVTLLEPGHIKALNNLGVSWFYLKRPKEAQKAFKQVLDYEPQNEIAKKNLERICQNLNAKEASK